MKASLQSLKSSKELAALSMQGPEEENRVPKGCTNLSLLGKHRKSLLWKPTSIEMDHFISARENAVCSILCHIRKDGSAFRLQL